MEENKVFRQEEPTDQDYEYRDIEQGEILPVEGWDEYLDYSMVDIYSPIFCHPTKRLRRRKLVSQVLYKEDPVKYLANSPLEGIMNIVSMKPARAMDNVQYERSYTQAMPDKEEYNVWHITSEILADKDGNGTIYIDLEEFTQGIPDSGIQELEFNIIAHKGRTLGDVSLFQSPGLTGVYESYAVVNGGEKRPISVQQSRFFYPSNIKYHMRLRGRAWPRSKLFIKMGLQGLPDMIHYIHVKFMLRGYPKTEDKVIYPPSDVKLGVPIPLDVSVALPYGILSYVPPMATHVLFDFRRVQKSERMLKFSLFVKNYKNKAYEYSVFDSKYSDCKHKCPCDCSMHLWLTHSTLEKRHILLILQGEALSHHEKTMKAISALAYIAVVEERSGYRPCFRIEENDPKQRKGRKRKVLKEAAIKLTPLAVMQSKRQKTDKDRVDDLLASLSPNWDVLPIPSLELEKIVSVSMMMEVKERFAKDLGKNRFDRWYENDKNMLVFQWSNSDIEVVWDCVRKHARMKHGKDFIVYDVGSPNAQFSYDALLLDLHRLVEAEETVNP